MNISMNDTSFYDCGNCTHNGSCNKQSLMNDYVEAFAKSIKDILSFYVPNKDLVNNAISRNVTLSLDCGYFVDRSDEEIWKERHEIHHLSFSEK